MTNEALVEELAHLVDARLRCIERDNAEWAERHTDRIERLVKDLLPSGSGWDHGTAIDLVKSTGEKLVFVGSYHHMNEGGSYDGWTDHEIIVTPSLQFGFSLKITGRNRNEIKDYLHEAFDNALRSSCAATITIVAPEG